jgi:hypothetical protein
MFIRLTDGKVHDVNTLDEILPEPGAFYMMDRGYIDFQCRATVAIIHCWQTAAPRQPLFRVSLR